MQKLIKIFIITLITSSPLFAQWKFVVESVNPDATHLYILYNPNTLQKITKTKFRVWLKYETYKDTTNVEIIKHYIKFVEIDTKEKTNTMLKIIEYDTNNNEVINSITFNEPTKDYITPSSVFEKTVEYILSENHKLKTDN